MSWSYVSLPSLFLTLGASKYSKQLQIGMSKGLSSSYMIRIKSTDEITALNPHEIISAQSSEIAHTTKANTVARYTLANYSHLSHSYLNT